MSDHHELYAQLGRMEGRVGEIADALKVMAPAVAQLATLEAKHAETRESIGRAFREIEALEDRVTTVEMDLPVIKLTSGWVQRGAVGALSVIGLALLALVIVKW